MFLSTKIYIYDLNSLVCRQYLNYMQKSMVHELNSLTHSTIFTNRPSLHLITHYEQHQTLRNSRIQNLPGYRKEDLSGKLNFIVVFQTIEIERLSEQIETLRVKTKDWERQRLNYQNYEVQIRQLTQRCHLYQLQREGIEQEQEKMKQFCENLYFQVQEYRKKYGQGESGLMQKYKYECSRRQQLQIDVQKWRNRYNGLDIARSKELQELRQQFQAKRQSLISKEIKELTIKYQNNISTIMSDLKKARSETQAKKSQFSRVQSLLSKYQIRQSEIKEIQSKMDEYENRFVLLSQQNYRLNELLRWKNEQIDRIRRSEEEFKKKFESMHKWQEENKNLKMQLDSNYAYTKDLEKFVENIKIQIEELRAQNQRTEEYEKLIAQFQYEIQRLNQLVHQKINQADQLKTTNKLYQTKLSSISATTHKEFSNYEHQIIVYTKEQERLNAQLRQRLIEIQQSKERIGLQQKQIQKYRLLQEQNERLRRQTNIHMKKVEQFRNKIILLQQNLVIMQEIENRLRQEEEEKRQMFQERQRLNNAIKSLTIQIQTVSQRTLNDKAELQKLQHVQLSVNEFHGRLNWMSQQLDRIHQQINQKTLELNKIKEQIHSLSKTNNNSQNIQQRIIQNLSQMEHLILQLDETKRENQRFENEKMNLEMSMKQLQSKIIQYGEEKEELTRIVIEKTKITEEYKKEILSYEGKMIKYNDIYQSSEEQKKKIESLTSTNSHVSSRLEYEVKKSNEYSAKIQELSTQIMQLNQRPKVSIKMTQQFEMIRLAVQEKNVVILSQKKRIQTIERMISLIKERYTKQQRICKTMYEQYQSICPKLGLFDMILDTSFRNYEQKERLTQTSLQTINNKDFESVEMCESYRVIAHKNTEEQGLEKIDQMNESQHFDNSGSNKNFYTFKDMKYEQNYEPYRQEHSRQEIVERDYSEVNSVNEARDTTSMASSFINTLITKESNSRFQPNLVGYFQNLNSPGFAKNVNQQRVIFHSPTNNRLFLQQENYENQNRYNPVQSQVLIESNQVNQIRMSPVHTQGQVYENGGIKRVTSVTHFHQPYFRTQSFSNQGMMVNHVQGNNMMVSPSHQHIPVANQQNSIQSRDVTPSIRILQAVESQNIANSTKNTTSHFGKPMRISIDPQRLTTYHKS